MQFGKAILSGVVLWAIIFALASVIMALGLATTSILFSIIMLIIALVVVWLITTSWYKPVDVSDAFLTGLIWLVISVVVDYFVIVQYFGKDSDVSYYGWGVLTGYAIILLFPTILKSLKR